MINNNFLKHKQANINVKSRRFGIIMTPFSRQNELNLSRDQLIELLNAATKKQLFQFNGNLYEQTDGVAMGSPLGPQLANFYMCSIEDKLDQDGKLPSYYRRYVDDTFTIMPDIASAEIFLDTRNHIRR